MPQTRGQFLLHLHPQLIETLRERFSATQEGSGITFEGYLGQLLECVAADFNLPNYRPNVEARPGRHNPRGPSHNAPPRKKPFSNQALAVAREIERDPTRIAAIMRGDE
ncbi:MAG: hypothetical protein WAL95_04890 [Candidatus Acidiferrales bacterium]